MHLHCEVIIPPTDDVESSVASVMKKFNERADDEIRDHAFWDWYVIGGRFAGTKMMARYDKERLDEFYRWLTAEKVTVSGLQCGKQDLQPASQIDKVDAKWNEMFPSEGNVMVACPIFAHSNDQYGRDGNGTIDGDICLLKDVGAAKCSRVIFAGCSYNSGTEDFTGPLEAKFMLCEDQWNGCNHMPIDWDCTVQSAREKYEKSLANYADGYRERNTPTDDWIAVTVDYHT